MTAQGTYFDPRAWSLALVLCGLWCFSTFLGPDADAGTRLAAAAVLDDAPAMTPAEGLATERGGHQAGFELPKLDTLSLFQDLGEVEDTDHDTKKYLLPRTARTISFYRQASEFKNARRTIPFRVAVFASRGPPLA